MPALRRKRRKPTSSFTKAAKLVVQGKGTQDFVEFVLEPQILQEVKLGYETVLNPELLAPRIGVDESGKGDFFGPLCIAGVYINETMIAAWKSAGIRDSKNIGSDRRIAELAKMIRGHARLRSCRGADWQRGLQSALSQDEERQYTAGLGARPRD